MNHKNIKMAISGVLILAANNLAWAAKETTDVQSSNNLSYNGYKCITVGNGCNQESLLNGCKMGLTSTGNCYPIDMKTTPIGQVNSITRTATYIPGSMGCIIGTNREDELYLPYDIFSIAIAINDQGCSSPEFLTQCEYNTDIGTVAMKDYSLNISFISGGNNCDGEPDDSTCWCSKIPDLVGEDIVRYCSGNNDQSVAITQTDIQTVDDNCVYEYIVNHINELSICSDKTN